MNPVKRDFASLGTDEHFMGIAMLGALRVQKMSPLLRTYLVRNPILWIRTIARRSFHSIPTKIHRRDSGQDDKGALCHQAAPKASRWDNTSP